MNDETYYGAPNDFRNYVMHFGILGMKWGVRRYQNPDGTLTSAGRLRYVKHPDGRITVRNRGARKYLKSLSPRERQKEYDIEDGKLIRDPNNPRKWIKKEDASKHGDHSANKNKIDKSIKNNHISTKAIKTVLNNAIDKYKLDSDNISDIHVTEQSAYIRKTGDGFYDVTVKTNQGFLDFEYDANRQRILYPSLND